MCAAAEDERWAQPGDEVIGSASPDDEPEATPLEALEGDAEAAAARRQAALEREADLDRKPCPRCGEMVENGVRRCPVCDALVAETTRCPICGARVDVLTANCPDCGTPNPKYKREFEL